MSKNTRKSWLKSSAFDFNAIMPSIKTCVYKKKSLKTKSIQNLIK